MAKSPKSVESEDLGTLDDESLRELEGMTSDVEPKEQTKDVQDKESEEMERAKQTNAAVKIQKLQRGKAGREKMKKQQQAAVKIQAAARGRVERGFAIHRANQRKKHFSTVYNGTREMEDALQYLFSSIDEHGHGHITKKI